MTDGHYGILGYDLGRVGRWVRIGYGPLIGIGAVASILLGLREAIDGSELLLQAAAYFVAIAVAYLLVYGLLGERLFARANPWLNTLILVGPALTIVYWNLTLGYAVGADLPVALQLAMLVYIGISYLVQALIGYGGCEVVAVPILVFRRRYVSYCLPIVMIDAAERGWVESTGLRRGLWVALGVASLVTITLGIVRIGPPAVSGVAFLVVASLVAALTYVERRASRARVAATSSQVLSDGAMR
jgi:hypothetical protein